MHEMTVVSRARGAVTLSLVAVTASLVAVLLLVTSPALAASLPKGGAKAGSKAKIVAIADLQRTIKGRKGKVLLLHFWATWCAPCLQELPAVNQFAARMRPRGLEVVSLSLDRADDQGATKVAAFLKDRAPNLTAQIVKVDDPTRFINLVDATWQGNIPAVFAFDPKGAMRGRHIGSATPNELTELVSYMLKPGK